MKTNSKKSIVLMVLLGLGPALIALATVVGWPHPTAANSYSPAQATPTLSINDVSLSEGNGSTDNLVFTVTLLHHKPATIGVAYDTSDGRAPAGAIILKTTREYPIT